MKDKALRGMCREGGGETGGNLLRLFTWITYYYEGGKHHEIT